MARFYSRSRRPIWFAVLISASFGALAPVRANDLQNQQALHKAQGLLKQLAQQKAVADTEVAKLRGEVAASDHALAKLKGELKETTATLEQANASLSAAVRQNGAIDRKLSGTAARLKKTEDKLREVIGLYRSTTASLRETAAAKQSLEATLAATQAELKDAEAKNLALYQVNGELLDRYKNKSSWDALLQREPATGINSVEIENRVQAFEDRMFEQLRDVNIEAVRP